MDYSKRPFRSNQESKLVRLIDDQGNMIGIVSFKEAQQMAQQKDLDLIEISPDAEPPVCKIGDYGRMRFKEQKKKIENRKRQKIILLKEVQLRPQIQEHDYQVKLNHARSFLANKDKVKLSLQFRGREISFVDLGRRVMDRMVADLEPYGKAEADPKLEGKRIIVIIAPLKDKEVSGVSSEEHSIKES